MTRTPRAVTALRRGDVLRGRAGTTVTVVRLLEDGDAVLVTVAEGDDPALLHQRRYPADAEVDLVAPGHAPQLGRRRTDESRAAARS